MWELDYEESWALKNWCFWSVVLQKTLESPLDCREIQLVHSKGDQSWVFFGRTDAEAETPTFWPPDVKSWLIGKDPDARKEWGQEEKGTTEDKMVGWHHWLNGHGFGWILGVGDGQGGLACCGSQGCKKLDTVEWLNWTGLKIAPGTWHKANSNYLSHNISCKEIIVESFSSWWKTPVDIFKKPSNLKQEWIKRNIFLDTSWHHCKSKIRRILNSSQWIRDSKGAAIRLSAIRENRRQ